MREGKVETLRDYHIRRIREELDLAYRTDSRAASSAHLRLSALHVSRLHSLGTDSTDGPDLRESRLAILA
jgi:hypothetical protein